ncbi:hypothetical protein MTO96_040579 [Rhipicephalus appendiculatus]
MGFDPYCDTPFRDRALHAEDSDPPPPHSPHFHDDGNDHGITIAYADFRRCRCACGLCGPMPMDLEQVCCRDIPAVLRESPDGCITQHEEFRRVCVSAPRCTALCIVSCRRTASLLKKYTGNIAFWRIGSSPDGLGRGCGDTTELRCLRA